MILFFSMETMLILLLFLRGWLLTYSGEGMAGVRFGGETGCRRAKGQTEI